MDIDIKQALPYINEQNITSNKIISILSDLKICSDEEINLLRIVGRTSVVNKIRQKREVTQTDYDIYMQILTKDYFIQKDAAACAIQVWAQLFNAQYNVIEQHEETINNEAEITADKIISNDDVNINNQLQNTASDSEDKKTTPDPKKETRFLIKCLLLPFVGIPFIGIAVVCLYSKMYAMACFFLACIIFMILAYINVLPNSR